MWFKKLLVFLKSNNETVLAVEPEIVTERTQCYQVLLNLDSQDFSAYRPINGSLINVETKFANIELYCNKLKELAKLIEYRKIVPSDWDQYPEKITTLDSFLSTSDGYYIEANLAVWQFRNAAITVCEYLKDADTSVAGTDEHNARVLTKLLINIKILTEKLIEANVFEL